MFIDKNITSAKQRSVIMVTVTSEITELMTEAGAGRLVNNCGSCHKSLKLQEYVFKSPIMNCNIAKVSCAVQISIYHLTVLLHKV